MNSHNQPPQPPRAGTATMIPTTKSGGTAAERAAWTFDTIATVGSSIGQIWVGATTPPWPASLPWWLRAALVLPLAVVIDLGGVVTSAFADADSAWAKPPMAGAACRWRR